MKILASLLLAAACGLSFAHDRPPTPTPGPTTQPPAPPPGIPTPNAAAGGTGGPTSAASSSSSSSGDAWAIGLPGHASPSYAGNYSICVNGLGFGWNFFWKWAPDMECVKAVAELERLARTPVPAKPVALLTEFPVDKPAAAIPVAATACAAPAKAKTVAAAKQAGACRS